MLEQEGTNPELGQGIHPYSIGRFEIIEVRRKPKDMDLMRLVAGVLVFLSVFAYGLRMANQRYGVAYQANEYAPSDELEGEFEFLGLFPNVSPALGGSVSSWSSENFLHDTLVSRHTFSEDQSKTDSAKPRTVVWNRPWLSRGMRFLLGIRTAQAAEFDAVSYKAEPLQREVRIEAAPGEVVPVEIFFRNLGSATWSPEGAGFISAYTTQPRYHDGRFAHASWLSSSQPARLASPSVGPGEVGIVKFSAQAPSTPGRYSEWMQLAAEDTAWVWGGHVEVVMTVQKGPGPGTLGTLPTLKPAGSVPQVPGPKAMLLLRSAQEITASANTAVNFTAGFKNTGDVAWTESELKFAGFTIASVTDASLRHASWPANDTAVRVASRVEPGRIGFMSFTLQTPKKRGTYHVRLNLAANGYLIQDAFIDIPVTVTNDYVEPHVSPMPGTKVPITSIGGSEPDIRVGLYYSEVVREEVSVNVPYEVRTSDGSLLASFQAGASVQAWYENGVYRITNGIVNLSSPSALRFVPMDPNGIITMLSHNDRPSWNTSLNDNRFRGIVEMRRHSSGRVWIINELPMEQYLWGLAETSNNSPMEFMKSLAVAARSYGNWHLENPGKYDDFTVGALNDQVYKGYGAELRYPNFKAAAQSTAGQVVVYNGENVITPYYSWSDGRTRAWTEVWGGSHKVWLVSVRAEYDDGKSLYGHGVGMSAWDAIGRANNGWSYDRILNYYYSGTSLSKLYS